MVRYGEIFPDRDTNTNKQIMFVFVSAVETGEIFPDRDHV